VYTYLQSHGFLGTTAGLGADLSLVLMVLAAVLFTIGVVLIHRKNTAAHRWVQTAAACLNAVLVLAWMIRSLVVNIIPDIPSKLGQSSYAVTTIHAVVGAVGLVLGLFVVLRANGLVPKSLQFANYKLYMRSAYVLYMAGTVLGVVAYIVAYKVVS
jgi:uncharacterized membrane protein YozB (DUF420 family)